MLTMLNAPEAADSRYTRFSPFTIRRRAHDEQIGTTLAHSCFHVILALSGIPTSKISISVSCRFHVAFQIARTASCFSKISVLNTRRDLSREFAAVVRTHFGFNVRNGNIHSFISCHAVQQCVRRRMCDNDDDIRTAPDQQSFSNRCAIHAAIRCPSSVSCSVPPPPAFQH